MKRENYALYVIFAPAIFFTCWVAMQDLVWCMNNGVSLIRTVLHLFFKFGAESLCVLWFLAHSKRFGRVLNSPELVDMAHQGLGVASIFIGASALLFFIGSGSNALSFFGYEWSKLSVATWFLLFGFLLLFCIRKIQMPKVDALVYSTFNIFLFSSVWEFQSTTQTFKFFSCSHILLPLMVIPIMLWKNSWKPSLTFGAAAALCGITMAFFNQLPFWFLRLPFALFSVALTMGMRSRK